MERKGTAHDPKHQGEGSVMCGHVAAKETVSLVFTDDVTADRSSKMNSEVCWVKLSTHILPNATKLMDRDFTVQMDEYP